MVMTEILGIDQSPLLHFFEILGGKVMQFIEQLLCSCFDVKGIKYNLYSNFRKWILLTFCYQRDYHRSGSSQTEEWELKSKFSLFQNPFSLSNTVLPLVTAVDQPNMWIRQ